MSRQKYKITGFAKFMLFMLIFIPLAYLGITAVKGESPKQFITEIKQKVQDMKNNVSQSSDTDEELIRTISKKDEEIQQLREQLFKCEQSGSSSAGN
ncbi:MAG: hypothetical protein IPN29_05000 [Saprospiraceae bacterium]|nr:hypothetical protein [Saprospiraceae bacterium]